MNGRFCRGQNFCRDGYGLRGNALSRCRRRRGMPVMSGGNPVSGGLRSRGRDPVARGCVAGQTHAVDLLPAGPPAAAARIWAGLDKPWQEGPGGVEALRTGNSRLCPPRQEITVRPATAERRGGPRREISAGARPRRDERAGQAAVPQPPGPGSHHHAPAVPAVRGRHPARPGRHRAVRRTGSLLGRMPRLRQAVGTRGAQDPAGQDRTAPR